MVEKKDKNVKDKDGKKLLNEKDSRANVELKEADGSLFVPPDGGWGWIVCFTSFWTNGTIFGIVNTFGIMFVKMIEEFGRGDKDVAFKTSWIGALSIGLTFFTAPVASILVDRIGIRITAFSGGVLATVGMLSSSFIDNIGIMYLTYGLLGMGCSLVYTPSLVILGHYFKKHLGIVNGIVAFGSAVFTIVLPFVLKVTLSTIGLRHTMRMLAGMLALLMLCALTWKPKFVQRHSELDHFLSTESIQLRVRGCMKWTKKFLNVEIWKNRGYVVWATAVASALLGYFIPFVHLVKHTSDIMPGANAEILVMCIGVTSGVGRLISGKIADLPKVSRVRMQQLAFVIFGIVTSCIPFARQFGGLVAITLIMGFCDGCFICLLGPIAFDLLGPQGAAQGVGFLLGMMSITMTAGPPLAGLVYDQMGFYDVAFYAAGAPPIIGAILMFFVPSPSQHHPRTTLSEDFAYMSRENLDKAGCEELDAPRALRAVESKSSRLHGSLVSKESLAGSHMKINGRMHNSRTDMDQEGLIKHDENEVNLNMEDTKTEVCRDRVSVV